MSDKNTNKGGIAVADKPKITPALVEENKNTTEKKPEIATSPEVSAILAKIEELEKTIASMKTKKAPRFPRAKYGAVKILDKETNIEYPSKAACAKKVAPDRFAKNHFVIYDLMKENPDRFVIMN